VIFAPGVVFNEEAHEYHYRGKKLSGVTGRIGEKLGIRMPEMFVEEARIEGLHIHKAIQKWITVGDPESAHPGVAWVIETFDRRYKARYSEVLVTDFSRYASAVDIVADNGDGTVDIFDIKKGMFKREYLSWQLGIYKYFIEKHARAKVHKCVCICVKDKEYYPVFPKTEKEVEELLYSTYSS
jgi:hypothetical protein